MISLIEFDPIVNLALGPIKVSPHGLFTAIGFVAGPICAGALYQVHPALAPMFSASVFFLVLVLLVLRERR